MKLKKTWYLLIPAIVLMTAIKVFQRYIEYTGISFFGKDNIVASYATIVVVALVFLILLIMTIANRSTSPVYNIRHNVPAGAMCLFAASITVVDIGCYMPSVLLYNTFSISIMTNIVFSALAAAGLFILSWTHISGKKPPLSAAMYMLTIPGWSMVKLITSLVSNSTNSVVMTDLLDMFVYLFLSIYLFNALSVVSCVKEGNPVKKLPLYGIPLMALLFTYDVSVAMYFIFNGYKDGDYSMIFRAVELTLFALYIFFFTREVTIYSKNTKDIAIVENEAQLLALFEKRREENIRVFEETRKKEQESGNYYIITQNGYDASGPQFDSPYGYSEKTYNSYGSYGKEDDDTHIVMGNIEDDVDSGNDNSVYVSSERFLVQEESTNKVDELILEITAGDNDLDLTLNENPDE